MKNNLFLEVSQIQLLGALTYRTRKKLCDVSNLYYYPGTLEEVANAFDTTNKASNDKRFPSIVSYQQVNQIISEDSRVIEYDLAIVANSNSDWDTEQREKEVFQKILNPIYNEFLKQISKSHWLNTDYEPIPHTRIDVYTTGATLNANSDIYFGDSVDFIRIKNLKLRINPYLCQDHLDEICADYQKVFQ